MTLVIPRMICKNFFGQNLCKRFHAKAVGMGKTAIAVAVEVDHTDNRIADDNRHH